LLNAQGLTKSYGAQAIFENVSFSVQEGDRLGLIGPNGSGKSTLLKILAGEVEADRGERAIRKQARAGYVAQDSVFAAGQSIRDVMLAVAPEHDDREVRVAHVLSQAGFDDHRVEAARLSGGWRKRLAICCGLALEPDLLLLDEPTNHLDLEGIEWLERLLKNARFACIVISHDRYFLENVATSVMELNRVYPEGLFRARGGYASFLEQREDYLHARAQYQESLANKVRREVEWLRRGPKARTTKSKARIDQAGQLMDELSELESRTRQSTAGVDFTASGRQTKKLLQGSGLSKRFGERTLFANLGLHLAPGTRLGLVGGNGSGKTTLLRLLTGELTPDAGTLERAEHLRVVYFDQNRSQLNPEWKLRRALCEHGDSVIFRERVIHVMAWAKRFLFRAEQLDLPVSELSGGEKARVLIARLMLEPADVLLLDEPTNDLDIPTLEVLEESLTEFPGALVLVTHDRYLLDRVSTAVLGIHGDGTAEWYADYEQWVLGRDERRKAAVKPVKAERAEPTTAPPKKKLSYLEAREWESMEARILEAEAVLEEKKARLQHPDVVVDGAQLQQAYEEMNAAQQAVDDLYSRWAEIEAKLT
jgi:ATP-binding cassette subfamily F protein uup